MLKRMLEKIFSLGKANTKDSKSVSFAEGTKSSSDHIVLNLRRRSDNNRIAPNESSLSATTNRDDLHSAEEEHQSGLLPNYNSFGLVVSTIDNETGLIINSEIANKWAENYNKEQSKRSAAINR
jgi:hypothetical protein